MESLELVSETTAKDTVEVVDPSRISRETNQQRQQHDGNGFDDKLHNEESPRSPHDQAAADSPQRTLNNEESNHPHHFEGNSNGASSLPMSLLHLMPISASSSSIPARIRSSTRIRKEPCPLCGKHFFDVETHASTCNIEQRLPNPSAVTVSEPKRRRTARVQQPQQQSQAQLSPGQSENVSPPPDEGTVFPWADSSEYATTVERSGASQIAALNHQNFKKRKAPPTTTINSYNSAARTGELLSNLFSLPSDALPPVPAELEANRELIQRERLMLQTAAAAAAANAALVSDSGGGGKASRTVELVEVEPGISLIASSEPLRDGQGEGIEFTLRHQILWLVEELHSVRESDSIARSENAKLRESFLEMQSSMEQRETILRRLVDDHVLEKEQIRKELVAQQSVLENQLSGLQQLVLALTQSYEAEQKQCGIKSKELEQSRQEVESLKSELDTMKSTLNVVNQDLETKRLLVTSLEGELQAEREKKSTQAQTSNEMIIYDEQPQHPPMDSDVDEYLTLLLQWLSTHQNSIPLSALAVFHGVKRRAAELWANSLNKNYTIHMLVQDFGRIKGIAMGQGSGGETCIIQTSNVAHSPLLMDFNDHQITVSSSSSSAFNPSVDPLFKLSLGGGAHPTINPSTDFILDAFVENSVLDDTRDHEEQFIDRVCAWLEENSGCAAWQEFEEIFLPSSPIKDKQELLNQVKLRYQERFFLVGSSSSEEQKLVLTSQCEQVLVSMLCKYLKKYDGVIPASRFAHFIETFPGALQVKEHLSPADSKLATLCAKHSQRIHFWRGENETAMCCLAEVRSRIEQEKLDKKRKEEELRLEKERAKLEIEKREAEEKARMEWELRKQQALQPPPQSLVVGKSPAPMMSSGGRWGPAVPASDAASSSNPSGPATPGQVPPPSFQHQYPPSTAPPPSNLPPPQHHPQQPPRGYGNGGYPYPPVGPQQPQASVYPHSQPLSANNGYSQPPLDFPQQPPMHQSYHYGPPPVPAQQPPPQQHYSPPLQGAPPGYQHHPGLYQQPPPPHQQQQPPPYRPPPLLGIPQQHQQQHHNYDGGRT